MTSSDSIFARPFNLLSGRQSEQHEKKLALEFFQKANPPRRQVRCHDMESNQRSSPMTRWRGRKRREGQGRLWPKGVYGKKLCSCSVSGQRMGKTQRWIHFMFILFYQLNEKKN